MATETGNNVPARGRGDNNVARRRGKSENLGWMARSMSDDGAEVLRFYVRVLRGEELETVTQVVGHGPDAHLETIQVPYSGNLRIQAGDRILDRGYGKSPQVVVLDDTSEDEVRTLTLEQIRGGIAQLEAVANTLEADATPAPGDA